jgi:hypothetical protein
MPKPLNPPSFYPKQAMIEDDLTKMVTAIKKQGRAHLGMCLKDVKDLLVNDYGHSRDELDDLQEWLTAKSLQILTQMQSEYKEAGGGGSKVCSLYMLLVNVLLAH